MIRAGGVEDRLTVRNRLTLSPVQVKSFYLFPISNRAFFKNKRIWIFGDLPRSADDNGLKLFKYVMDNDDSDVKKYFVVQTF